jgi:chemotaxis protein methyltransferase CheR
MDENSQKLNFDKLSEFSQVKIPPEEEFVVFKKRIAPLINLDLSNYKNKQMERRIASLMNRNQLEKLAEYAKLLETDRAKLDEFVNMLTINVSEFFRNFEKFKELETAYIPELLKNSAKLKIWSAGCSIGAEIYSLAMIFDTLNVLDRCEFVASDFDQKILEKAKNGIYSEIEFASVQDQYKKYFNKVEKNNFKISEKLISKIRFERRDLLNSQFEKDFDLILCRNVVIYFTDEAKDKLYKKFHDSLKTGGILFIGSTERINNHRDFGYNLRTSFFYQK